MKTQSKWTKADAKRAAKMGWELREVCVTAICKVGDHFKSDDEAKHNVLNAFRFRIYNTPWRELLFSPDGHLYYETIEKAVWLCMKG